MNFLINGILEKGITQTLIIMREIHSEQVREKGAIMTILIKKILLCCVDVYGVTVGCISFSCIDLYTGNISNVT